MTLDDAVPIVTAQVDFATTLQGAVALLVNGQNGDAEALLSPLANSPLTACRNHTVSLVTQGRMFVRDSFTCRYCGRRTVLPPVLRLVATVFPHIFPYHPHQKMTECHIAFWREISSCDHIVPVARGGDSTLSNLATCCYMCNSIKQQWLIEEMRWSLLPPSAEPWDGLLSYLPGLRSLTPDGDLAYYRNWQRALDRALHESQGHVTP